METNFAQSRQVLHDGLPDRRRAGPESTIPTALSWQSAWHSLQADSTSSGRGLSLGFFSAGRNCVVESKPKQAGFKAAVE